MAFTRQLTDVQLAATRHRCLAGVADVRVVCPDDHPAGALVTVEVDHQLIQRVGHVAVAQVPRRRLATEDRAVVLLGVGDDARVLLGDEHLVFADEAVTQQVLAGAAAQLHELLEHSAPTGVAYAQQHRLAVTGTLAAKRL